MQLIALTGGIASGKSTVARRFERLGAGLLDADHLSREAVAPGSEALERIGARFGSDLIGADGGLDRAALAAIVFADPESLRDLNAIVHPAVQRLGKDRIEAFRQANPDGILVYDVPLLVEAGSPYDWDAVIVTESPVEVRVRRMVELRGMDERDARNRIANQASDDERRAVADFLIDTGGSEESTLVEVDRIWAILTGTSTA